MLSSFAWQTHNMFSGRTLQFYEFLKKEQLSMLEAGDARRAQLDTIEKVEAYAKNMRKEFLESLGEIPMRDCPLDAHITKTIDMGNYIIENVIFKARDGVYVSASLYLPKGLTEPAPAILFLSGHADAGRMSPRYQGVCQTFAEAGLIVFAVDPMGQGDRLNFYDPEKKEPAVKGATTQHDTCGIPSVATGRFLQAYFVAEQFAAVDYMLTRKEIDPARIGVTGCSGGGTQTLVTLACDDRIAAGAPVCFTSNRTEILYTNQSQDAEQIWPGCAVYGFDHYEPFIIFAPKPAVILTASADFFPIDGAIDVYEQCKKIYGLYGKEDNLRFDETNVTHSYDQSIAEKATDFFCEVFGVVRKHPTNIRELSQDELSATVTGSVYTDYADALSSPDETAAIAAKLRAERKSAQAKEWLWDKVYHARQPVPGRPKLSDARLNAHAGGFTGKYGIWWVQKQLAAFGVLISKGDNPEVLQIPTVIAIWENGTKAIAKHQDWIMAECEKGKQVLVVDLPGMGDLEQGRIWWPYEYRVGYGPMYKMCDDLIYMGDSMPAMQTYHLIRTMDMVKECLHIDDISLYCDDQEGVYGIMAGYLTGVKREYGENLLTSVEEKFIRHQPITYDNTLSYLVPGMLAYFDYDELMD
ncbi:MAG: hypothetical protein E7658_07560 [Ruminococcaceae bacterium]|nr:hypothetical protein [Oscillospiraceae bacterium]